MTAKEEIAELGVVEASALLRPAIYFLFHLGALVYIGQSKVPLQRLYAHRSTWGKRKDDWRRFGAKPVRAILFDEIFLLRCAPEALASTEEALIRRYRPRYNIIHATAVPVELEALLGGARLPPPEAPIHRRF